MDFKIGDEIEDKSSRSKGSSNSQTKRLIIIVGLSIIFGIIVFMITFSLFGPKEEKPVPVQRQTLSLSEENVQILYQYISYGRTHPRENKFIKEMNTTVSSFTDEEKFYYALQFLQPSDLTEASSNDTTQDTTQKEDTTKNETTTKETTKKSKVYFLREDILKGYMERFFGTGVEYSKNSIITTRFNLSVGGKNIGTMTYNSIYSGYEIVFEETEKDPEEEIIKPYYSKLNAAYKEVDGSYTLEEKIIYVKYEQKEDKTYNIRICKDYSCNNVVSQKYQQTEEMVKASPIDLEQYIKDAATIRYTFKINPINNYLYFYSSQLVEDNVETIN